MILHENQHISLIINKLKHEKRLQYFCAFCLIVFSWWIIYHCFDNNIWMTSVGLALLLGGIWYLNQLLATPILLPQLIQRKSRKIVWVYSMITQRMPFGLQFSKQVCIYFKLIDGDEIVITIPEKELNEMMKTLNHYLPHATFGYSKDKEQWFMASPEMMYKDL